VNVCFQDMPCGHTCRDPCHFFRPHSKCKETVMFVFPKCGHASSRPCHKPEENFYCKYIAMSALHLHLLVLIGTIMV
jgi:hypothetical protein